MSDEDVFMIATAFGDVAELGQGYINRADGERILVPLPTPCPVGEGVRFIVQLGDGTPAFAGAGRCVQVSDQGDGVEPNERFETLLDSLAFDERSQPVYEYIVAVRQAVYAAGGPEAAAEGAAAEGVETADSEAEPEVSEEQAAPEEAAEESYTAEAEPEAQETIEVEAAVSVETYEAEAVPAAAAAASDDDLLSYVERAESLAPGAAIEGMPSQAPGAMPSEAPVAIPRAAVPVFAASEPAPPMNVDPAAFVIAALPSGMLQRPTVATHWQPATPRFPQASRSSGMFRYAAGALPVPQLPPRPAMDASSRVSRAPAPN